jgi:hypothetical protein
VFSNQIWTSRLKPAPATLDTGDNAAAVACAASIAVAAGWIVDSGALVEDVAAASATFTPERRTDARVEEYNMVMGGRHAVNCFLAEEIEYRRSFTFFSD